MQFYSAYKVQDVLDLYAVTFYALLNEGYRKQALQRQWIARLNDYPHLNTDDRKRLANELQWAATHPSDILNTSGSGSTDAEIKKALGG